ncbi:hypothetical protein EVAR_12376_1 [Eumeta japonica]|uniref:Uncharacterized protein n=1 Tax=Eumeta variegata TaxID=151549 RepID=A0A4C1TZ44_EUMVA|nr:hypothetical protein EVAR_12376_1 [Eumeta japonica]
MLIFRKKSEQASIGWSLCNKPMKVYSTGGVVNALPFATNFAKEITIIEVVVSEEKNSLERVLKTYDILTLQPQSLITRQKSSSSGTRARYAVRSTGSPGKAIVLKSDRALSRVVSVYYICSSKSNQLYESNSDQLNRSGRRLRIFHTPFLASAVPEPAEDQEKLSVGTPTSWLTVTTVSGSHGEVVGRRSFRTGETRRWRTSAVRKNHDDHSLPPYRAPLNGYSQRPFSLRCSRAGYAALLKPEVFDVCADAYIAWMKLLHVANPTHVQSVTGKVLPRAIFELARQLVLYFRIPIDSDRCRCTLFSRLVTFCRAWAYNTAHWLTAVQGRLTVDTNDDIAIANTCNRPLNVHSEVHTVQSKKLCRREVSHANVTMV